MSRAQPSAASKRKTTSDPQKRSRSSLSGRRSVSVRTLCSLLDAFGMENIPSKQVADELYEQAHATGSMADFRTGYLLAEVLSKWCDPSPESAVDRTLAAFTSFTDGEAQCAATNHRLTWDPYPTQVIARVIGVAQSILSDTLGRFDHEEFIFLCAHGSGATAGLPRRRASPQNKWVEEPTVTAAVVPYVHALGQYFGQVIPQLTVVGGDVITTVRKNAVTDRNIGLGPGWNVFFQKGLGRMIRRRLWRRGLLKKDAQAHHQKLARIGSRYGALATIDLKNASSTIAHGLVDLLLEKADPQFLSHLTNTRSGGFRWSPPVELTSEQIAGRKTEGLYEMFSAMGNAYTFELETALFWSLAKACCLVLRVGSSIEECSVYGDDIVVPVEAVPLLREVFTHCGLTFNARKSYWNGPFRESCGGHYYRGHDVTPFYLKGPPDRLPDLVTLHNNVSLWLARGGCRNEGLERVMNFCRQGIPKQFWGPPGIQGCAWVPFHLQGGQWHRDHQAWSQKVVYYRSSPQQENDLGAYLQWLWVRKDTIVRKQIDASELDPLVLTESLRVEKDYVSSSSVYHDGDGWTGRKWGQFLAPYFYA